MSEVTRILSAIEQGDPHAAAQLLPLVYEELRQLAAQKLAQQFQRRLYDQSYLIGAFERASYSIYQPWVHDMLNNYGASPVPYWWPATAWMDIEAMPASRRTER